MYDTYKHQPRKTAAFGKYLPLQG
jgi:hypothetical protein